MEKEFIDWLIENHARTDSNVITGIGDDAAVVRCDSPFVITTDTISDGTHFDRAVHDLSQIGHKAIAVNLSDIAAMGAKPVFAIINLICPQDFSLGDLKILQQAMYKTSGKYDVQIVGGDTNRWDGNLVVGATAIGIANENSKSGFWKMDGGKPGDTILVTGPLGGSICGKHIEFEPRVDFARYVMQNYYVNAATDITDSLAIDLAAVASKSNCGFILNEEAIPIAPAALDCESKDDIRAVDHALYDGEDFELLLCVDSKNAQAILGEQQLTHSIFKIGELTSDKSFSIRLNESMSSMPLEIRGYEH